jgi:N-acetylglucosaminyldiphosphoundecaprenol N-acetyl-beta-D-mannosaminyltransferase
MRRWETGSAVRISRQQRLLPRSGATRLTRDSLADGGESIPGRHLLVATKSDLDHRVSISARATPARGSEHPQPQSDEESGHIRAVGFHVDVCMASVERQLAHAAPIGLQGAAIGTDTMLIGGIPTLRASRQELAMRMVADCALARSGQMATPRVMTSSNGHVIARFRRDAAFRDLIMQADAVDADGQPLVIASRLFSKTPLRERVATTDFIHDAAKAAAAHGLRFYFLGAKPGVAQVAADHLRSLYSDLQVVGVRDGYFGPAQENQICRDIVGREADVLWVGLGSPAQESFAIRNREKLAGLGWIKTCGGMFDHYSGEVSRAPMWMQNAGLEWLYRMIREPLRLGPRYLTTNLSALYHLITATSNGPVPPPSRDAVPVGT